MAPLFEGDAAAPQTKTAGLLHHSVKVKRLSQYVTRRIVAKVNPELGGRD
jgi:hypothetical protein